jgi:tetratricopeptide (TPR) repeat protein
MLADIAWREGRSDDTTAHLDDARALVADAPPSRIRVSVLSAVARFEMLGDRNGAAAETGTEALRLAEKLGFEDLRANALNTVGCARSANGDRNGIAQIEESIAVAARASAIPDLLRGHNNLSTMLAIYGDVEGAWAVAQETARLARHYGIYGQARFIEGGAAVGMPYLQGRWDDALASADSYLARVEKGAPHYQAPVAYCHRGLIRLGRGDLAAAESDAEQALDVMASFRDPQVVLPTLAMTSHILHSAGNEERAAALVADAIDRTKAVGQLSYAAVELHYATWVAMALGREAEVVAAAERDPVDSGWRRATLLIGAGELSEAAEIYDEMGALSLGAFYRLQTGVVDEVQAALEFYRGVRATRYVRQGEALLAATA